MLEKRKFGLKPLEVKAALALLQGLPVKSEQGQQDFAMLVTMAGAGVRTGAVTYGLNPESLRGQVSDVTLDDIRALPAALLGHEPGSSVLR